VTVIRRWIRVIEWANAGNRWKKFLTGIAVSTRPTLQLLPCQGLVFSERSVGRYGRPAHRARSLREIRVLYKRNAKRKHNCSKDSSPGKPESLDRALQVKILEFRCSHVLRG